MLTNVPAPPSGTAENSSTLDPPRPAPRAAKPPTRVITGGDGVYNRDRDGTRRLLDDLPGLYCVNGLRTHRDRRGNRPRQARELAYYHSYVGSTAAEASITLAKEIQRRAPGRHCPKGLFRPRRAPDPTKTKRQRSVGYLNNILGRPEKKEVISRWRGYHGSGW